MDDDMIALLEDASSSEAYKVGAAMLYAKPQHTGLLLPSLWGLQAPQRAAWQRRWAAPFSSVQRCSIRPSGTCTCGSARVAGAACMHARGRWCVASR